MRPRHRRLPTGGIAKIPRFPERVVVFRPPGGCQAPSGARQNTSNILWTLHEAPEQAVLREAFEESGLTGLAIISYVGCFAYEHHEQEQLHQRHVFILRAPGPLPQSWVHVVSAGEGDTGLRFRYFWIPIADARGLLAANQGEYLGAALSSS
jgi:ADP-ribose pyrophosphatase YjhB (NUDIX family)